MNYTTTKTWVRWTLVVFLTVGGVRISAQVDCLGVTGGTALPGTACDDGLPTQDDTWSDNCQCIGMCYSDSGPSGPPGSVCNDGNPNTAGDTWDEVCFCGGTGGWIDCEGIMGGTALPGAECDDGNTTTTNDVWSSTCACIGDSLGVSVGDRGPIATKSFAWPNPVHEVLYISMVIRHPGIVRVTIIDPQGRTVLSETRAVVNGFAELPVRQLPDGLYTVWLESGVEVISERFAKVR